MEFLSEVDTKGEGPLQFSYPAGVAFNAANNTVYVTELDNQGVQVLTAFIMCMLGR